MQRVPPLLSDAEPGKEPVSNIFSDVGSRQFRQSFQRRRGASAATAGPRPHQCRGGLSRVLGQCATQIVLALGRQQHGLRVGGKSQAPSDGLPDRLQPVPVGRETSTGAMQPAGSSIRRPRSHWASTTQCGRPSTSASAERPPASSDWWAGSTTTSRSASARISRASAIPAASTTPGVSRSPAVSSRVNPTPSQTTEPRRHPAVPALGSPTHASVQGIEERGLAGIDRPTSATRAPSSRRIRPPALGKRFCFGARARADSPLQHRPRARSPPG